MTEDADKASFAVAAGFASSVGSDTVGLTLAVARCSSRDLIAFLPPRFQRTNASLSEGIAAASFAEAVGGCKCCLEAAGCTNSTIRRE